MKEDNLFITLTLSIVSKIFNTRYARIKNIYLLSIRTHVRGLVGSYPLGSFRVVLDEHEKNNLNILRLRNERP